MFRNVSDMHTALDFLIDKVKTPRFIPSQRDIVLNMAMDRIIQDRYDNIRTSTGYSYQSFQRIRDELRPIVKKESIVTIFDDNSFDLPDDYRHEVLLEVYVNLIKTTSVPIGHDELGIESEDPFTESTNKFPRHIEEGNKRVRVYFKSGFLNKVDIYYLINPPVINILTPQDCILPGHLHDEVINLASQIINGTVSSIQRYKISEKETKES